MLLCPTAMPHNIPAAAMGDRLHRGRTWNRILARSRGATAVLAAPPATPPAISSCGGEGACTMGVANERLASVIPGSCTVRLEPWALGFADLPAGTVWGMPGRGYAHSGLPAPPEQPRSTWAAASGSCEGSEPLPGLLLSLLINPKGRVTLAGTGSARRVSQKAPLGSTGTSTPCCRSIAATGRSGFGGLLPAS